MYELIKKFRDVFLAVLPVVAVVLVSHFFLSPFAPATLGHFFIGALYVWLGLSVFLIGIEIAITPLGEMVGKKIARSKKLWIILGSGFLLGFLITIAEPDLLVVSSLVDLLTGGDINMLSLVGIVALFIGIFIAIGLFRILFAIPLYQIFLGCYAIIFLLMLFVGDSLHAIAFDVSGATTGAMTVPFVLAIALGIASMEKSGKGAEKDSFGLIGIASAGAVISVLLLLLFYRNGSHTTIVNVNTDHEFLTIALQAFVGLLPLFILGVAGNLLFFKLRYRNFRRILFGFFYTYVGLLLFLYGVYSGFLDVGRLIGTELETKAIPVILLVGFCLGFFAILAEPAVYILTGQINHVTSGFVSKRLVLLSLALGVGIALVLNLIRTRVVDFPIFYLLLPGYLLALGLMFVAPKLFVGMAFDAGGVASGPIAATFILAFSQGIALGNDNLIRLDDAFGMIATVALVPVLMVEILGVIYKIKVRKAVQAHENQ